MQAKYVGKNGEYIGGIPMRDLTDDDWSALDAEQRKQVRSSPLYDVEADKEPAKKKEG